EAAAPGEAGRDGARRGRRARRTRLEEAKDDLLAGGVEARHEARRRRGRRFRLETPSLLEGGRLEGRLAGEQLVEHETERVEIALDGDLASRELLRRHVGRRAGADVASDLLDERGEPAIRAAATPPALAHDVR